MFGYVAMRDNYIERNKAVTCEDMLTINSCPLKGAVTYCVTSRYEEHFHSVIKLIMVYLAVKVLLVRYHFPCPLSR